MRILLTNDDGIKAKGLKVLEEIAQSISDDLWIVAPLNDQSGVSHALSLHSPLRIEELEHQRFSVSGTPTDCVMLAKHHILKDKKIDLVLSGINQGANLAEDITYSGTVAAAIEATLLGIPSFALSLTTENRHTIKWSTVEHFGPIILKELIKQKLSENVFLNINFPNVAHTQVKDIKITVQGQRTISDNVLEKTDPRGNPYYWVGAGEYRYENVLSFATPGTDLEAIGQKCISISPLSLNLTHPQTVKMLKEKCSFIF